MANRSENCLALSAAGAGTYTSQPFDNLGSAGLHLIIDITAITGTTPTLTVSIEAFDAVSGKWYALLTSAALNAVATTVLRVLPAGTVTANLIAQDYLPRQWRVKAVVAGTTPAVTATIGANLMGA